MSIGLICSICYGLSRLTSLSANNHNLRWNGGVLSAVYSLSSAKDQMEQAARSGKQNIVEGSLPKSYESCLKLIGVARGSFGELLEDYKDFLRQRSLPIWKKTDARVLKVRAFRESIEKPTNLSNLANWSNLNLRKPEDFANLMICLIYKETFLVDRLLRATEEKFVREGGFRENLFKKRREFKKGKLV